MEYPHSRESSKSTATSLHYKTIDLKNIFSRRNSDVEYTKYDTEASVNARL
jgi:hypothetical protein